MNFLAKLKAKEKEILEAKATQPPKEKSPESSTQKDAKKAVKSENKATTNNIEEDEGWLEGGGQTTPSSSNKHIQLLDTPVIITKPEELVWAPHYRFRDKRFCARLCENSEASTEPSIKVWPIPDDLAIVEFFCQEKISNVSRLMLVERKKICPFWAEKKDDDRASYPIEEQNRWNEKRLDEMRKQLESKYNSLVAKFVYDRIVRKADEFLSKAIQAEEQFAIKLSFPEEPAASRKRKANKVNLNNLNHNKEEEEEDKEDSTVQPNEAVSVSGEEEEGKEEENKGISLQSLAYCAAQVKGKYQLAVGDDIVYYQKAMNAKIRTRITKILSTNNPTATFSPASPGSTSSSFSPKRSTRSVASTDTFSPVSTTKVPLVKYPLELENGHRLSLTDMVGKVVEDKDGDLIVLKEYQFEAPVDIASSATKRRKAKLFQ